MRAFSQLSVFIVTMLASLAAGAEAMAQPARSGGYDISYGVGTATGDLYVNQKGAMTTVEVHFSTRLDGTNTPFLMGAHIGYFASEDPLPGQYVPGQCITSPEIGGCAPSYPDMAFAGLQAAFEPLITSSTFLHFSAGGAFLQPSSAGGPTLAVHGVGRIGQGIGRHLGITLGARAFFIPDLRGWSSMLTTYTVGVRIR